VTEHTKKDGNMKN